MSLFTYFLIGTLFTLGVDICCSLFNAKKFNTLERIACIFIWPITIVGFIIAFYKEIAKKK